MHDIKISIITVAFNAEQTISNCMSSVAGQNYNNTEYIVIDGASTDGTLQLINKYKNVAHVIKSEPDNGIYDAMNKGIKLATGHIIGILNADDVFTDNDVLSNVADAFANQNTGIVYGDIDYVNAGGNTVRKWRSGKYFDGMFNQGWMPPHTAFFCKRSVFEKLGSYSLDYGTAADYELMLRFIHVHKVSAFYLQKTLVKMRVGGASNNTIGNRFSGLWNDFKAMRSAEINMPLLTLVKKPLRKIGQYLFH